MRGPFSRGNPLWGPRAASAFVNLQTSTPMRSSKPMSASGKNPDATPTRRADHPSAKNNHPSGRARNTVRETQPDNQNSSPGTAAPRPDDPGFDTNLIGSLR
jgi:hypothetical protein